MVLCEHPPLKHEYKEEMDDDTLYTMLEQMGSVAGVFFKAPETFITPSRGPAPIGTMSPLADEDIESVEENEEDESSEDSDEDIDIFADEDEKKEEPKKEEEPKSDDSFDDIFK